MNAMLRKLLGDSAAAVFAGLVALLGLACLGAGFHLAILPRLGPVWAWILTGGMFLLATATIFIALAVRGSDAGNEGDGDEQQTVRDSDDSAHEPPMADATTELQRGLAREVQARPLRALSLAAAGGAVFALSPHLRRTLLSLAREAASHRLTGEDQGH